MKVNASAVAALIGKNPYKSVNEAVLEVAVENNLCDTEVVDYTPVLKEVSNEISNVCNSKSVKDLDKALVQYETKLRGVLVQQKVENVDEAFKLLKNEAIKTRGCVLEKEATDKLETITSKPVSNRNTNCYIYNLPRDGWVIAGRTDGLQDDDTVIEIKNRKRMWKNPPEYDIIQLRVYLKLTNRTRGILSEHFPDGSIKNTEIQADETIWNGIETSLVKTLDDVLNTYSRTIF